MKQLIKDLNTIRVGDYIYISESKNALGFEVISFSPCQKTPKECDGRCSRKMMTVRGTAKDYHICLSEYLGLFREIEEIIINKVTEL